MEIEILDYSNNTWTIESDPIVFGTAVTFELEEISDDTENEEYTFALRDFYSTDIEVVTPYSEAHNANATIDPAKVLLWILKKIKEALCPECQ